MIRDHLHFILVRTQFASNLGSATRALKNMGFSHLALVKPQCEIGIEARALAMKGAEVLAGLGFPRHISRERLLKRLKKIAGLAELEQEDINMLHGILTEMEKRTGKGAKT